MFILKENRYVEEIQAQCFLYRHPTGARLLHIQNEDENKVFYAAFPTPCENDKGIPHIVEHCVLAGSKRYPVKDPFHEMSKSSFNTYLNAMTYGDKTVYPIASVSSRDFRNLTRVYLDAVFCPLLREETFLQEGWNDRPGKGEPGGIVYNEMSGVYSDPAEFLKTQGFKTLFPNSPYRFDAGGVPEAILTLGYQEFLDFYRERYHPSRCCFYFYGNMEIEEYLTYIDETYLASFPAQEGVSPSLIKREKDFGQAVVKTIGYNFSSNPSEVFTSGKPLAPLTPDVFPVRIEYLYSGKVMGTCHDFKRQQARRILLYYMLGTQSSPLKRAILDSGLGQEVKYGFHGEKLQPVSTVIVHNSSGEPAMLMETEERVIRDILRNGLDGDMLEACIAKFDFALRDYSGYRPKGLVLGLRVLESWLHEESALEAVFDRMSPLLTLDSLKKKDCDYFLDLLQTDFIDNPHAAYLKLAPKAAQSLQDLPDTEEALQTIPFVALSERLREEPGIYKVEKVPLDEKNLDGLKLLFHPMDTKGIVYMDILFNTDKLPEDLLPGIQMLTYVLGKLASKKYDTRELSRILNRYFGEFSVSFEVFQSVLSGYHPKIMIKVKCLSQYLPIVLDSLNEILCNTLFQEDELHKLLLELASKIRNQIVNEGQLAALTRLMSYFSEGGRYKEMAFGVDAYSFLRQFLLSCDKSKNSEYLQSVAEACITRENAVISLTCEQGEYERHRDSLRRFYEGLPEARKVKLFFSPEEESRNEAFITATRVQYVTAAWDFKDMDYKGRGRGVIPLAVHILNTAFLMGEVRIAGGAYGCHCRFLPMGILYFYSYRDPHLRRTLEVYERAFSFLQDFKPGEKEMDKYKVGALNPYLRPKSNEEKGRISTARYFMDITQEDLEREREELLGAETADIRQLGRLMSERADRHYICVNGSGKAIRECSELFGKVNTVE